jgi:outer membrane protein
MTPAQAQQAVRAFRSAHPVIRQAALTETRLGSARIVFALSSPISVAPGSGIGSVPGRPDRRVVALRAPEKAAPSETQFAGVPGLDLRVHRVPRDDERGPAIRAVDLGSVRNAAATPAGRRFSLVDMLETALERDPRYAASRAESRAIEETVVQARADYLPVAAFDFQRSFVRYRTREAPNPTFPIGSVDYPGQGIGVTLTQPLFRLPALRRMDQAALSVEQSRLNVLASEQDLILRVATAYLNLLAATDARDLARAEREATGRELDLARTRQRSGLATPVQLYEVEARNALAEAREIEAGRAIEDARYAIKEIVGDEVASVRGLRRDFVAVPPVPSRVEDWVEAAMEQNLALQARSLATQIAQIEIERQRAGHYPTVDAVLSYNRTDDGGSLYGGAQRTDVGSAGVRVRVPLYEGGRTSSLVREALARHDRSLRERDEELRRTERVARAAFRTVNANINSMEALRKSVLAQGTALAARIEGYRSGVTSIVAVVDAYRLYFSAYRDYLQVRYDYLLNRLRLKQAVGTLSRNDLQDLTALLE